MTSPAAASTISLCYPPAPVGSATRPAALNDHPNDIQSRLRRVVMADHLCTFVEDRFGTVAGECPSPNVVRNVTPHVCGENNALEGRLVQSGKFEIDYDVAVCVYAVAKKTTIISKISVSLLGCRRTLGYRREYFFFHRD